MSEKKKRILILCVDRDNDIGVKTRIKTPIVGRDNNLEAASNLALIDPEECDANALFGAVRAYDDLSKETESDEYEIATIVGSETGGVKADKNLRDQLIEVLNQYPSDSVILVSDGFSDEEVIPIVQSHVPILSIDRIVVKHSERIEESWAIFYKYLNKLIQDPYYSRWALGVPGVLLIALAILSLVARDYVGILFLIFIGTILAVKGFSVDKKIEELVFPSPPNLIRLFTAATALIITGLDSYQTYVNITGFLPQSQWLDNVVQVIGYTMSYATNLLVVASCILLVGIAIYFYLMRDTRIWWSGVGIVAALWMREISLRASVILISPGTSVQNLLLVVGFGIATILGTILITHDLSKRFEYYFNRNWENKNEKS